ncbi:MAG: GAF domain-containing protein [Bacteroidota bacterium]
MKSIGSIPVTASRAEKYRLLLSAAEALMDPEAGPVANMSNLVAIIREAFGFHWVGFYLVNGNELTLGPFQGPPACTRIALGKGVCGTAWKRNEAVVVPDVNLFPGHIACSALSKSEVVVPFTKDAQVIGVLDIDSDCENDFSEIDIHGLTALLKVLDSTL